MSVSPVTEEDILRFMSDDLTPGEEVALRQAILSDPVAVATLAAWTRQDHALSNLFDPVAKEPVPQRLLDAVRSRPNNTPKQRVAPAWLAAGLACLCFGLGGIVGRATSDSLSSASSEQRAFRDNAVRAYETYVTETNHFVEVSTAAPYLMDWLSNRLGHDIVAPDLRQFGFTLLGGRVLPAEQGNAAFLMYEGSGGQRLTLYVAPGPGETSRTAEFMTAGTVQIMSWSDDQLTYAMTGQLPETVLRDIAESADSQL